MNAPQQTDGDAAGKQGNPGCADDAGIAALKIAQEQVNAAFAAAAAATEAAVAATAKLTEEHVPMQAISQIGEALQANHRQMRQAMQQVLTAQANAVAQAHMQAEAAMAAALDSLDGRSGAPTPKD